MGLWLLAGLSIKVDNENPVVRLVVAGTRAEYEGRSDEARTLYREAWEAAGDDYEACIAAHYVARCQDTPLEVLRWNELALAHAEAAQRAADSRVADYFPSLYLSLGRAHENAGDAQRAQRFYDRAAALGVRHRMR